MLLLEMYCCMANLQKSGQSEGGIDNADNADYEKDHKFGSLKTIFSMHLLVGRGFSKIGKSIFCTCWKY